MQNVSRRGFLCQTMSLGGAALTAGPQAAAIAAAADARGTKMRLGLVTYLWGKDWDLPTLITNCEMSGVHGVELRTTHAHGVEPSLTKLQRREVKQRFDDSPVVHVGPGSNERFDHPDSVALHRAIEATKAFAKLSHDTGGTGVKVKPNSFHEGVDRRQTMAQIARSLNTVGRFAGDYGQEIRLEVHGQWAPLPIIKQITDQVEEPNVGLCWNSNPQDLEGKGLAHNFNLVKDRFGATAHVRELNLGDYPYQKLVDLLVIMDYAGWILLECRTDPPDRVQAMIEQRRTFERMVTSGRRRVGQQD